MQRGLLNLGFSLGPLVGGGTYETSRGRLSELDTSSDTGVAAQCYFSTHSHVSVLSAKF